ncbi:MAG: ROK family protein [bacterium]|nr:ROK family protein [bacterium]
MSDKVVGGVDVGGTKILTGVLDGQGRVLGEPVKVPTGAGEQAEAIMGRLYRSVEESLSAAGKSLGDVTGIGIGVPGPLKIREGVFIDPIQLKTLHGFPIRRAAAEHFKLPVEVNNDANCFVLAESFFGAAAGAETVLGFTLGTGFGCGIVINKQVHIGATETGGEIWFSPYKESFIEDYVSGRGLQRNYRGLTGNDAPPPEILERAREAEKGALKAWELFGQDLAYAIAWSINILDPDVVVLGGSLVRGFEFFVPATEDYLRKHICSAPAAKTRVVPAKLGDSAGFIGAACLVVRRAAG